MKKVYYKKSPFKKKFLEKNEIIKNYYKNSVIKKLLIPALGMPRNSKRKQRRENAAEKENIA